ncbi:MAG: bacteriohemerythrin [Candidatus Thiodiazotropha sp. (ex Gloverina cf. vestifex)]|nr:bacteriohemerythrin [Candidatus Thiodiazotropha sp. (ex Gloverina cf. vestifex)]
MKPFLRWRDDWLLGLDELDVQHLAMAALLNGIHDSLSAGGTESGFSSDAYRRLLDLAEITREHFRDEEHVMRDQGYPGLGDHHREHALLLAELQDLIRHIEEGTREFTMQTLTALKHWQIDHVLNSDREFADYCRRHTEIEPAARPTSASRQLSSVSHNSIH